jgi:hypothetical protein
LVNINLFMNIFIAVLAGASVYYQPQYPTLVLLMSFVCGIFVSVASQFGVAVIQKGLDREAEERTRLQD